MMSRFHAISVKSLVGENLVFQHVCRSGESLPLITMFEGSPPYDSSSRTRSFATVLSEYFFNTYETIECMSNRSL